MKVECKCKQCKQPFMARVADRKRGWGRFCSKSCKAKKQTKQMPFDKVRQRSFKSNQDKGAFIESRDYIDWGDVDDKNNYGNISIEQDYTWTKP